MSNYTFTGVLKMKGNTVQVSEKFSKREFVLVDSTSQYPQDVQFQLAQDKCSLIDNINVGDPVICSFNIKGKEWINPQGEAKYFNTLEAWKIEKVNAGTPNQQIYQANDPVPPSLPSTGVADDSDDLPF